MQRLVNRLFDNTPGYYFDKTKNLTKFFKLKSLTAHVS